MDSMSKVFGALCLLSVVCHPGSAATNYNCDDALVSSLPQTAFDSSSQLFSYSNAKLNIHNGAGGWTPMQSDNKQWLQIDLGERLEITGAETQGRPGSSDWVTKFSVMFSDTGHNWKHYHQDNSIWVFSGNTDSDGVVSHKFQPSIKSRFLRFVPLEWNPRGRIGLRVEVYGCSYKPDVANFDGRSALLYRFNQKLMTTYKDVISLRFKSMQSDGVLFHGEGQRGDYITLELQKGRLSLSINLGDAKLRFSNTHTVVTLGSLLDDQHWHSVLIDRFNKQVNFTVDNHTQQFRTKGESDNLDIDYEFSFGGIPVPGKPGAFLKRNFHGCVENLYYNGVNIINLARRRKPQIYIVGNITFSCSEPSIVPITFLNPSSSFLLLPGTPKLDDLSVSFQFRTWNSDGLLLSTRFGADLGVLLVQLYSGKLLLMIQREMGNTLPITSGNGLNDGLWHTVTVIGRRHHISLTLDNEALTTAHVTIPLQISTGHQYYFGGCPDHPDDSSCINPITSFQGCMRLIFIENRPINLILVQRGVMGNFSDLQMDMCGIRDRCLTNYCEHGGICSQTWSTFHCDCGDMGYADATCHSSLYEQSCEAYKHKGYPSDFYYIDPDGSGPLEPVHVYCDITEEKMWTIVHHNSPDLTSVHGEDSGRPYVATLAYRATTGQLEAMMANAEYCEQEAEYHCKHSRMFNSPSFSLGWEPYTWWIGRGNVRHTYWGGSLSGQCQCALEDNCIDMRYYCNCDADTQDWTNDTGLLTFKEHLPVSQIVITDTHRPGSEVAWRIGPLRCYGDRSFWNSASFSTMESHIYTWKYFPNFSIDIMLFFKTSSSSGVLVEALDEKNPKHFVRIELVSPYQVTFSFDAGNGPVEVSLHSATALNDGQWHHVAAERNVKETSLVVDNQPRKLVQTLFHGQTYLPMMTDLFVGGTASKQKGFVGCIRNLKLNGVTLDLEGRAEKVRGVRAGCPGHCSTYGSLCHNNGKCVERHNGYTCDCTNSAYEGPYCKKEVSAMFRVGTSVTYVFREPYPVSGAIYADTVTPRETIAFSFLTAQAPSLLLYLSSFHQDYLAVLLCRNGSLQVRYKTAKEGMFVFTLDSKRLDDRKLHHVKISREGRELTIQIDKKIKQRYRFYLDIHFKAIKSLTLGKVLDADLDPEVSKANAVGFIGCLSSVQYNQLAPLKAALRGLSTAPLTVNGSLSECNCGSITEGDLSTITTYSSSDPFGNTDDQDPLNNEMSGLAVIGGAIATAICVIFCIAAILTKIIYHHKNIQIKSKAREKEYNEKEDYSFHHEKDLQNRVSECRKEYFI